MLASKLRRTHFLVCVGCCGTWRGLYYLPIETPIFLQSTCNLTLPSRSYRHTDVVLQHSQRGASAKSPLIDKPYIMPFTRKLTECATAIFSGDRSALGQAITLIESVVTEDRKQAEDLLHLCFPKSGNSVRLGITGSPGVGKSSLIETLGEFLIREQKRKVAVLAVDPTSALRKGSILGDKTRMPKLASNPRAFVRPSPAASSMGGVAFRTREAIILCEAAGYDTILIETVGVGQSQFAVSSMIDFLLLLVLPGGGDSLQGMKRGIMETADLVAVTKVDGDNIPRAKLAYSEYRLALDLHHSKESKWQPRMLTCSALQQEGMMEIWNNVQEYLQLVHENGYFAGNRRRQMKAWLKEKISEELSFRLELFFTRLEREPQYKKQYEKLFSGDFISMDLVRQLIKKELLE